MVASFSELRKPALKQCEDSWQKCWASRDVKRTTLNNGYLGSRNDEERSEMRYVV